MLAELKELHAAILTGIDTLEQLAGEEEVRPDAIATARLKLTRASRKRTRYLETIVYPALMGDGATGDAAAVQRLREEGLGQLAASTNHIGKWTIDEVTQHWADYRAASRLMRAAMRERIRDEQAVLYPLLSD